MSIEWREQLRSKKISIGLLGAIGSRKTVLAEQLSSRLGLPLVTESFTKNPYLSDFYGCPREFSFRLQLWCLKNTVDDYISSRNRIGENSFIMDPSNEMNKIFANTQYAMGWMDKREINTYDKLYRIISDTGGILTPDVYIWLNADDRVLSENLKRTNKHDENLFLKSNPDYLPQLVQNLTLFVEKKRNATVIYVDAGQDFTNDVFLNGLSLKIKRVVETLPNVS